MISWGQGKAVDSLFHAGITMIHSVGNFQQPFTNPSSRYQACVVVVKGCDVLGYYLPAMNWGSGSVGSWSAHS